jgi:hypothetical protein
MKELTIAWNGGTSTRTVQASQLSRAGRRFRIGRDPATCDLVLPSATPEDLTVSKLHVELYFDVPSDTFYLQNLKGSQNPPRLYGQAVLDSPAAIDKTGTLQLGRRELQLTLVVAQPVAPPIAAPISPPTVPLTIAPPEPPQAPAHPHPHPHPPAPPVVPVPAAAKPLVCPHCHTDYSYEESAQLNGRCPRDGFLLHGVSIYVPHQR